MMGFGIPKDQESHCSHRMCLVPTADSDKKRSVSEGTTHPTLVLINQLLKGISAQTFSNLAYQYSL